LDSGSGWKFAFAIEGRPNYSVAIWEAWPRSIVRNVRTTAQMASRSSSFRSGCLNGFINRIERSLHKSAASTSVSCEDCSGIATKPRRIEINKWHSSESEGEKGLPKYDAKNEWLSVRFRIRQCALPHIALRLSGRYEQAIPLRMNGK
jgi:hypothetical protein